MNKNYKSKENIQWIMVHNKPKECLVTNQIYGNRVTILFRNNKKEFNISSVVPIRDLYPTKIDLLLSIMDDNDKEGMKERLNNEEE